MNYLKQHHLSILVIVFLALSSLFGGTSAPAGLGTAAPANQTTIGNPWVFTNTLTISSNYLGTISTAGTQKTQTVSAALVAATTTPCTLQNPFSATSTVRLINFNITTASSAPSQMIIATSSSPNATTSPINSFRTGISLQGTYSMDVSSTTSGGATTGYGYPVVGPSGYVVIGSSATSSIPYTLNGVYTFGGNCSASFQTVL